MKGVLLSFLTDWSLNDGSCLVTTVLVCGGCFCGTVGGAVVVPSDWLVMELSLLMGMVEVAAFFCEVNVAAVGEES